jgi:hypothetical protein
MNFYYFCFFIFATLAYFIVTDESVARFTYLIFELARVRYEKTKWWILHNPANPIVKYLMWRRSWKLAKELMKEYERKDT